MDSFNEIEFDNDGTRTIWDLYSIIRPDIEREYNEISHFDARFIIKERNGVERRITDIGFTHDAKPINPPTLSARDRSIEDYLDGKGPKPYGFTKAELNTKDGDIINGYVCGARVNGYRVNSEAMDERALRIGDIIFTVSGRLTDKEICDLYEFIWKRGPIDCSFEKDEDKGKKVMPKHKPEALRNWNFCLDLWGINAFNGCKCSSIIRVRDADLKRLDGGPVYRNWKRIYKDFATQNVVLELC